jgi:hypothetical protein
VKRLAENSVDLLTVAHKLIGAAWVVCAIVVLVFVVPVRAGGGDAMLWSRIVLVQRIAAYCSVATLLVGFAYGIWTTWGFFRYRQVVGKWVLFLGATAFNGPTIIYARAHLAGPIIALTLAELVVLAASMGLGVYLERARHTGTMAGPLGEG